MTVAISTTEEVMATLELIPGAFVTERTRYLKVHEAGNEGERKRSSRER